MDTFSRGALQNGSGTGSSGAAVDRNIVHVVELSPSAADIPSLDRSSPPPPSSANSINKKCKRRQAGKPDADAEVVALTPKRLMESDRYVCEICSKGFQRDQNLQMHKRRHKVPWTLPKRGTSEVLKRVYVCPVESCLHHNACHALGDLVGIRKHYRRKHSTEKQWQCEKCSKGYAVQSDYKAHVKSCGARGHFCDCGRVFSRVESFIEHHDECNATVRKERGAIIAHNMGDRAQDWDGQIRANHRGWNLSQEDAGNVQGVQNCSPSSGRQGIIHAFMPSSIATWENAEPLGTNSWLSMWVDPSFLDSQRSVSVDDNEDFETSPSRTDSAGSLVNINPTLIRTSSYKTSMTIPAAPCSNQQQHSKIQFQNDVSCADHDALRLSIGPSLVDIVMPTCPSENKHDFILMEPIQKLQLEQEKRNSDIMAVYLRRMRSKCDHIENQVPAKELLSGTMTDPREGSYDPERMKPAQNGGSLLIRPLDRRMSDSHHEGPGSSCCILSRPESSLYRQASASSDSNIDSTYNNGRGSSTSTILSPEVSLVEEHTSVAPTKTRSIVQFWIPNSNHGN
jgi:hypothetical protein